MHQDAHLHAHSESEAHNLSRIHTHTHPRARARALHHNLQCPKGPGNLLSQTGLEHSRAEVRCQWQSCSITNRLVEEAGERERERKQGSEE